MFHQNVSYVSNPASLEETHECLFPENDLRYLRNERTGFTYVGSVVREQVKLSVRCFEKMRTAYLQYYVEFQELHHQNASSRTLLICCNI